MRDLYLVRHGQTMFNLKGIIQGWSDSPLTPLGRTQAQDVGAYLHSCSIDATHAYCSTLSRAAETLQLIVPHMPFQQDPGLREWFFGRFEAERVALMPPRPWGSFFCSFEGESQAEVRARMVETLTEIMMRPNHERVLVVSHASAIKEFSDHWLGSAADETKLTIGNCSISHFRFDECHQTFKLIDALDNEQQKAAISAVHMNSCTEK